MSCFSSSSCQGLAATYACGTPWTFLLIFLFLVAGCLLYCHLPTRYSCCVSDTRSRHRGVQWWNRLLHSPEVGQAARSRGIYNLMLGYCLFLPLLYLILRHSLILSIKSRLNLYRNEPPHDKTNNVAVRPAKTQISPGWSESSLCAQSFCGFCHEAAQIAQDISNRSAPATNSYSV